jgi:hypothetical protein
MSQLQTAMFPSSLKHAYPTKYLQRDTLLRPEWSFRMRQGH